MESHMNQFIASCLSITRSQYSYMDGAQGNTHKCNFTKK